MNQSNVTSATGQGTGANETCRCLQNLEEHIVSHQPMTGLKVLKAKFDRVLTFGDRSVTARPVLEVELTVDGKKKPVRRSVIYGFCPFCGTPFEPLSEEKEVQS